MNNHTIDKLKDYWNSYAEGDPLFAILSDSEMKNRKWNLPQFIETGFREINTLMYKLNSQKIDFSKNKVLDFGCGIGRLSLPLSEHFENVVGVDISKKMIDLADKINFIGNRIQYKCNQYDNLALFEKESFDFIYSNIVLQHCPPVIIQQYLNDFYRILKPGGLIVFQLPSHLNTELENNSSKEIKAMNPLGYQAHLELLSSPPINLHPNEECFLKVAVKNKSNYLWDIKKMGPIRLGNHWLNSDGSMVIQDDGRTDIPLIFNEGEESVLILKVKAPPIPGNYSCEIDLVHEGVSWFKDKGSQVYTFKIAVSENSLTQSSDLQENQIQNNLSKKTFSSLPENNDFQNELQENYKDPGPFPMYGIEQKKVCSLFENLGAKILKIEEDFHCGGEWVGYRYYIRK